MEIKAENLREARINTCFQQAGDYIYTVKLVDLAGNIGEKSFNLKVYPQNVSAEHSDLVVPNDCNRFDLVNEEKKAADGVDICTVGVILKDKFDNVFAQFNDGAGGKINPVITSYSIHYTKLYD